MASALGPLVPGADVLCQVEPVLVVEAAALLRVRDGQLGLCESVIGS